MKYLRKLHLLFRRPAITALTTQLVPIDNAPRQQLIINTTGLGLLTIAGQWRIILGQTHSAFYLANSDHTLTVRGLFYKKHYSLSELPILYPSVGVKSIPQPIVSTPKPLAAKPIAINTTALNRVCTQIPSTKNLPIQSKLSLMRPKLRSPLFIIKKE